MSTPIAITPVIQLNAHDCGLRALEMLLGVPYAEVRAAFDAVAHRHAGRERGVWHTEMERAAGQLRRQLRRRRKDRYDITEETGILTVHLPENEDHYVVLFQGVVINPTDGVVYDRDAYLADRKGTPGLLLVV